MNRFRVPFRLYGRSHIVPGVRPRLGSRPVCIGHHGCLDVSSKWTTGWSGSYSSAYVPVQHVLHSSHELPATSGMQPSFFFHGLSCFFEYLAHRLEGDALGKPHRHHLVGKQLVSPIRVSCRVRRCTRWLSDVASLSAVQTCASVPVEGDTHWCAVEFLNTDKACALVLRGCLINRPLASGRSCPGVRLAATPALMA